MPMNFLKNWNFRYKEEIRYVFQALLFILTFLFTTIAGAWWSFGHDIYNEDIPYTWEMFKSGLPFSISFLSILTIHEFGHYFVAKLNKVKTSLPYYIPLPPFPFSLGTMGAVIRIRQRVYTNVQNFAARGLEKITLICLLCIVHRKKTHKNNKSQLAQRSN